MIYRLTVECIDGWHYDHETIRIIEVDENIILYDLFDIIREANGFGWEHGHMFYLGRNPRNKKIIFSNGKDFYGKEYRPYDSSLKEIYPLGNLKFYFLYDFGDNWIFQIRKSRKRIEAKSNVRYPRIIEKIGEDPLSHLYNE
ncbi:MAG: hypothetical protein PF482_08660 [Desulfobacteraceae bacterium]|jgi:hypothetical protein|nr:hypothetical protein [Desulfobacteraceae bacterium]